MRVLVVEPEHKPEVRDIDDSLKAMQKIVGGLIQPIYLDESDSKPWAERQEWADL